MGSELPVNPAQLDQRVGATQSHSFPAMTHHDLPIYLVFHLFDGWQRADDLHGLARNRGSTPGMLCADHVATPLGTNDRRDS